MRALLLATAFVLLAGCTFQDETATGTNEVATPGVMLVDGQAQTVRPSDFTTAILEDATFQHGRLVVGLQTTVIWWNVDDLTHSVVSDDGQFAGSGPIPPEGEFARTFQTAGEYAYHCRYHPDMKGVIVVE